MTAFPEDQLPEGWDALSRADEKALAPPPEAKDRVRVQIAATLGLAATLGAAGAASSAAAAGAAAAGVGAGSGPATLAGAAKALLVQKLVLGVVAVSAVTGGTAAYVEVRAHRQEAARRTLQQHPSAPVVPASPITASAPPAVEPVAIPDEPARPLETLGDERALLDQARGAIARGRLLEAQALLQRHATTYPAGTLAEEREALQIRLLVRQGRSVEAAHRAARFRHQHPHSIQLPVIDEALRSHR